MQLHIQKRKKGKQETSQKETIDKIGNAMKSKETILRIAKNLQQYILKHVKLQKSKSKCELKLLYFNLFMFTK